MFVFQLSLWIRTSITQTCFSKIDMERVRPVFGAEGVSNHVRKTLNFNTVFLYDEWVMKVFLGCLPLWQAVQRVLSTALQSGKSGDQIAVQGCK